MKTKLVMNSRLSVETVTDKLGRVTTEMAPSGAPGPKPSWSRSTSRSPSSPSRQCKQLRSQFKERNLLLCHFATLQTDDNKQLLATAHLQKG